MDLTDIVTYLSLIVAIVFFIYQEVSKRRNKTKEVQRLKDEFINMIIRNHINSNLEIVQVDFDTVISGFEKLKSCKLLYSKKDFLEMIYAKVSDNEHIESRVRIIILKQTKAVLTDIDLMENIQDQPTNKWVALIPTFGTSVLTLLVILFGAGLVIKEDILPDNPLIIVSAISFSVYFILKLQPFLENIIEFAFIKDRENNENQRTNDYTRIIKLSEQVDALLDENIAEGSKESEEQLPKINDNKHLTIDEYLKDGEKVLRVAELRVLLELKLNEYFDAYFERKKEQKIKPNSFMKISSLLESENALNEDEVQFINSVYTYANNLMHKPNDQINNEILEFISDLEFIIHHIDNKISNLI